MPKNRYVELTEAVSRISLIVKRINQDESVVSFANWTAWEDGGAPGSFGTRIRGGFPVPLPSRRIVS